MQQSVGYYIVLVMLAMMMILANGVENEIREVGIGVILDMDSNVGKSTRICILMALEQFYGSKHKNFTTIIHPHFRDSKYDNFQAASAAIDLLKETKVMALLGPQQSSQADFILDIANTFKVPIMSPATSPDISSKQNPYFIRIAQTSSTQSKPIAALVKSFGWKEIVFVYEDTDFGRGPIPYLFDAMENIGTQVKYHTLLSPSSSDDTILQQLHKLKTKQTRVFVVHMLPTLASRFFKKANQVGMMTQGYVWIITDVLTALLHHLDPQDLDSKQGVLGVKPFIPPSNQLTSFQRKWRTRFNKEYPNVQRIELDMFAIWSYDSTFALATALQRVETKYTSSTLKRPKELSKDLEAIGTSDMGFTILSMLRNIRLKGVSGNFHVINGQLQTSNYQLVNVIGNGVKQIGFWNSRNGLTKLITNNHKLDYTTNKDDLGSIIWPGDTLEIPTGLQILNLRVGLPVKRGFVEFVEAYKDPITNLLYVNGYCIDVFYAVIDALSHVVNYTLIPYENADGKPSGNYNDLVYQVYLGKFDMAVGDIAILWNRSNYVDFTLPYAESGIAMLVPVKADDTKNAWIFMKPLETKLWVTIGAFFIYTGLVVWVLEHRVNKEFRGSLRQQVGIIFWFSFSTLVFAHREKMINNLSRFVVIVWVFVVLVLTSSYTASLSSMLTVQKLQPSFTNIYDLLARGDYIGYPQGSFVKNMLINMGFPNERLKMYVNFNEYAKALTDGSKNNGVSAIVDGVPYLKMLQAKNCNKYLMVGPIYKTAGMGFAFPKGSPLVAEFSRAILKVVEGQMKNISNKWFGKEEDCPDQDGQVQPFDKLTLDSFKGLFLIAGLSSTYAVVVYLVMLVYKNKEILLSEDSKRKKWTTIITNFYGVDNNAPFETEAETVDDSHVHVEENVPQTQSPDQTISDEHQVEGVSSPHVNVSPTTNVEHQGGVSSPR